MDTQDLRYFAQDLWTYATGRADEQASIPPLRLMRFQQAHFYGSLAATALFAAPVPGLREAAPAIGLLSLIDRLKREDNQLTGYGPVGFVGEIREAMYRANAANKTESAE